MALALSRRVQQGITIGNDIHVLIADVQSNGQVRLAITAPREMEIYRDELVPELVDKFLFMKEKTGGVADKARLAKKREEVGGNFNPLLPQDQD